METWCQGLFNGLLEAKALPGANDMDNDKNALYARKLSDCSGFFTVKSAWVKKQSETGKVI